MGQNNLNRTRLFVSAFWLSKDIVPLAIGDGQVGLLAPAVELIAALRERGFDVHVPSSENNWVVDCQPEIDRADGLVALVDRYWMSSTYKNSELSYAVGQEAMPTFIFWLAGPMSHSWLYHSHILPEPIPDAVDALQAYFIDRVRPAEGAVESQGTNAPGIRPLGDFRARE
jgi:hypothetical protein